FGGNCPFIVEHDDRYLYQFDVYRYAGLCSHLSMYKMSAFRTHKHASNQKKNHSVAHHSGLPNLVPWRQLYSPTAILSIDRAHATSALDVDSSYSPEDLNQTHKVPAIRAGLFCHDPARSGPRL